MLRKYPNEKDILLARVEEPMDTKGTQAAIQKFRSSSVSFMPEIDAYIHLLVLVRLIDTNKNSEAVQSWFHSSQVLFLWFQSLWANQSAG